MLESDATDIRVERHQVTQEDFTPESVVNDMLACLPDDTFTDFSKTILDPSCGIGNFLVEVLRRRLEHCKNQDDAIRAMKSIYGVELMADNVEDCRQRLYDTVIGGFPKIQNNVDMDYYLRALIRNRIQWCDSLEFDYEHWKPLKHTKPCAKHERISFHETRNEDDELYPMWHKNELKQLDLFNL